MLTSFSARNRGEYFANLKKGNFDLVFTQCGFQEALICLLAAKTGLRTALLCEDDFSVDLSTLANPSQTNREGRQLVKLFREKAPHLILPDEFLNLQGKSRGLLDSVQNFLDSDKQNVALKDLGLYEPLLRIEKIQQLNIEKAFKLDPYRLLMSVLKQAVAHGAIVLNHVDTSLEKEGILSVQDQLQGGKYTLSFLQEYKSEEQKGEPALREFQLRLTANQFRLKRSLQFQLEDWSVHLLRRQDYYMVIARGGSGAIDEFKFNLLHYLNGIVGGAKLSMQEVLEEQEGSHFPHKELANVLLEAKSFFSSHYNWSLDQFRDTLHQVTVAGGNFGQATQVYELIEYGDQRCDEAKQTGISASDFKPFFYRYGVDIEELTEKAYELRTPERNGWDLWQEIEIWFTHNYEMACSVEDYLRRQGKIYTNHSMRDLNSIKNAYRIITS